MTFKLDDLLSLAKKAATEAGELIASKREQGDIQHDYKDQQELVTNADLAADALIVNIIKERFPDHRFLTEETCKDKSESKNLDSPIWIIDPIDGTVNYAHGQQMVGVSIAFACEGEMQVGVVYNPFMEEMFSAINGQAAELNGESISVSGQQNLRKALFATGFPYDKSGIPPIIKRIVPMLEHTQDMRRLGSAALDICWVACGRLDIYFESLSPWDFAAARLIAQQAGATCGHFSDVPDDTPACIYAHDLLISSPALYAETRAILRKCDDLD
jgi:myo-inositol-1(or 4)-monophosphatase